MSEVGQQVQKCYVCSLTEQNNEYLVGEAARMERELGRIGVVLQTANIEIARLRAALLQFNDCLDKEGIEPCWCRHFGDGPYCLASDGNLDDSKHDEYCRQAREALSTPADPEPFMALVRAAVAVKNEADKLGEEGYQLEGSDSLALDALIDAVESLPDWGRRV